MSSALQIVGVLIMQGTFFLVMHTKFCRLICNLSNFKLLANSNQEALPCYGFVSLSECAKKKKTSNSVKESCGHLMVLA